MSVIMSPETKALVAAAHKNKGDVCPLMKTPRCKNTCGIKTKLTMMQAAQSGKVINFTAAPAAKISLHVA